MKILICTTVVNTIKAFLIPHVEYFKSLGWKVDGMANGIAQDRECLSTFDCVFEARWHRSVAKNFAVGFPINYIRAIIANGEYDIVHVHTPIAAFLVRFALRSRSVNTRTKIVYTAHGFHFHPSGSLIGNSVFSAFERMAGRWTDALITINQVDFNAAKELKLIDESKLYYFPGVGIDCSSYSQESVSQTQITAFKRELDIDAFPHVFLMIAEFNPGKRHRDLVAALYALQREDCCILFAGEGRHLFNVKSLVERLGLKSRVRFLGYRKDIPVIIRASRAVILPSEREGLPRSLLESLALEVPIITSDVRGCAELADQGCGLVHKLGDIEGIGCCIDWMCDHPLEAAVMGRSGRAKVQRYGMAKVVTMHADLYRRVRSID